MKLLSLTIENFKGIKHLEIKANGKNLLVTGKNGSGKSTIPDAINWLWYGKNVENDAKFSFAPIWTPEYIDDQRSSGTVNKYGFDSEVHKIGEKIHNLTTKVSAVYLIDGKEVTISRSTCEKWQKKRGSLEHEFTGYETSYECSDESCGRNDKGEIREKDFSAYAKEVCPENIARIILDGSFLLEKMEWIECRKFLAEMAGVDLESLKKLETQQLNLKGFSKKQKEIAEEQKKEVETLSKTLTGISGKYELEEKAKLKQTEIELIDKEISRISNDELTSEKNKEKTQLESDIIKLSAKQTVYDDSALLEKEKAFRAIERAIDDKELTLKMKNSQIEEQSKRIEMMRAENSTMKSEIEEMNRKIAEFNQTKFDGVLVCPLTKKACNETDALDNQEHAFNSAKVETLKKMQSLFDATIQDQKELVAKGSKMVVELKELEMLKLELEKEIENLKQSRQVCFDEIEILQKEKANFKPVESPEVAEIQKKIGLIELEINQITANKELIIAEYKEKQNVFRAEKAEIEKQIATIAAEENTKKMIAEALDKQKEAGKLYADYQKQLFDVEEEIRQVAIYISEQVNSLFSLIKWQMFDIQVNGGLKDCCIPLIAGVPYSDSNTASKINASIDVSNAVSRKFKKETLCFVDNAESVELLMKSINQMIICKFMPEDLKIEVMGE